MILYYGSLEIVESPQILDANRPLDFGSGFYTTTNLQQARRWVLTRMEQQNMASGYINMYEYTPQKGLLTRRFQSANEEWVNFVHANRSVEGFTHDYDIVTGPVANDNISLGFNLYESGIITKRELMHRLKTYKLVDQLLFHTASSLQTLKYIKSKDVKK